MPSPDTTGDPLEIVSSRVFDAGPDAVFDAFADPRRLARWWGPNGFTNTIETFAFEPGGAWRLVMHAPDGQDIPNASTFLDIVRPERIVFDHAPPHYFRMTLTFEPEGMRTRFTMRMRHDTIENCELVRPFVVPANEEVLDRLGAELARPQDQQ
jgi:uncharacterized protein YndB with AHSA1/START domain